MIKNETNNKSTRGEIMTKSQIIVELKQSGHFRSYMNSQEISFLEIEEISASGCICIIGINVIGNGKTLKAITY